MIPDSDHDHICLTGPCPLRNAVREFAEEMERIMQKHDPVKGDTWKTCPIEFLEEKLEDEFAEYKHGSFVRDERELIDIANIAMMLWYRKKVLL